LLYLWMKKPSRSYPHKT